MIVLSGLISFGLLFSVELGWLNCVFISARSGYPQVLLLLAPLAATFRDIRLVGPVTSNSWAGMQDRDGVSVLYKVQQ